MKHSTSASAGVITIISVDVTRADVSRDGARKAPKRHELSLNEVAKPSQDRLLRQAPKDVSSSSLSSNASSEAEMLVVPKPTSGSSKRKGNDAPPAPISLPARSPPPAGSLPAAETTTTTATTATPTPPQTLAAQESTDTENSETVSVPPTPATKSVRFHPQHSVMLHMHRSDYSAKRLERCYYTRRDIHGFLRRAEKMAKKLHKAAKTVSAFYSPLHSESDDLRGLEHHTVGGKARRNQHIQLARSAVLEPQQKTLSTIPQSTTPTSTVMTAAADTLARLYAEATAASRDRAVLRGALYAGSRPTASRFPLPPSQRPNARFVSIDSAILMHQLHQQRMDGTNDDDDDNDTVSGMADEDNVSVSSNASYRSNASCRSTASARSATSSRGCRGGGLTRGGRNRRRKPMRKTTSWRI